MQAAFFDLDKTVIARSSGLLLGRNLYKEGLISKRLLLRGMAAQLIYLLVGADEGKMEQMRERALALTKGWEKAKIERIVEEVMGDVITPIIYKEASDLIDWHQGESRKVYIVSSSPQEIVQPLGVLLGVDGVIASRAKVDEEGRYTGELDFYCYGAFKAEAMQELAAREGIVLEESYAYTDSITDVPMLRAVGHPAAVNPDRELKKIALQEGWPVLNFTRPITIRKRLADLAPDKAPLVTGGLVVGLGALAAGYLWASRRRKGA